MSDKNPIPFMEKQLKDRFLFLLIALLAMMVLSPMLEGFVRLKILTNIFMTIIFASCFFAVCSRRRTILIAVALALPMFFSMWFPGIAQYPSLVLTGDFFGILFMAFVVVSILSSVFKEREVSANTIYASIVIYLLLAVMWTYIFRVIETLQPGSFAMPEHTPGNAGNVFIYYSFVTITTLGYGDITPVKDVARAFSTIEAVIGQIYLVVLVSRLVGLNIAQTMHKER